MKICIIGTGAVGGFFGSLLYQSGADITFVGTAESVKKIKSDGLIINNQSYPVKITDNLDKIVNQDLILLAVKSYHLPKVARNLKNISSLTTVICLQNGINNDLAVKKIAPNLDVHPGLVYVSAQKISSGVISQSGPQRTLIFGRRDRISDSKFVEIETILRNSGIDAKNSTDIEKDLWEKYIFVVSFATVTVRFKTSIGPALADPIMRNYYLQSLREVIAVAKAEKINLDSDILEKSIAKAEKFPPETKSSFLVDLESNRPTEIKTLHETVVNFAQKHHILTPAIQEVIYQVNLWAESRK